LYSLYAWLNVFALQTFGVVVGITHKQTHTHTQTDGERGGSERGELTGSDFML